MFNKNIENINYTKAHQKAFSIVERILLGHNTLRSRFHDFEKPILYRFFDVKKVHNFHRNHSRHHSRAKTHEDYIQMVVDWECARFTKPDKPLNAYQTLYKYYPELEDKILPILHELGLDHEETKWVEDAYNVFK